MLQLSTDLIEIQPYMETTLQIVDIVFSIVTIITEIVLVVVFVALQVFFILDKRRERKELIKKTSEDEKYVMRSEVSSTVSLFNELQYKLVQCKNQKLQKSKV
jgi:heme/copper-type cytochrome/quinol oxidase subunit 2